MEENKKVTTKGIPFDALVKIEVSGSFAGRLQQLLIFMMEKKSPGEIHKIIEELRTKEPEDVYSFNLLTIIILIQEIEKQAIEQGLIKDFEVDKNSINES